MWLIVVFEIADILKHISGEPDAKGLRIPTHHREQVVLKYMNGCP
jgi:hypothetical protein